MFNRLLSFLTNRVKSTAYADTNAHITKSILRNGRRILSQRRIDTEHT